jgi:hypothetical protein
MAHHFLSIGVLGLSLIMTGCTHSTHTQSSPHEETAKMVQTREALRDLWVSHIFWIRNVVWDDAMNNPAARDAAEKEVLANAKQIANTIQPFYGDAASEELLTLLAGHYGQSRPIQRVASPVIPCSRRQHLLNWRPTPTTLPYFSAVQIRTFLERRFVA